MSQCAVVFAYHNVGVRGLAAVLANGVDVKLVVTHADNPEENIWFDSVADLAGRNDIPVIRPEDPNCAEVVDQVRAIGADWIFSFYYRHMLGQALLDTPKRGALNLHGSLLPRYRGRVPVNWAVLNGEKECGASLHRMVAKPDAGGLIDQEAVPILPNDTAHEVFQKVTCAAEVVLMRALPKLLSGTHTELPLDLAVGSYFGGRKPADSRIDWSCTARQIHNLVRAVAPPYPPAFFDAHGHRIHVLGSYFRGEVAEENAVRIYWEKARCYADCADGQRFEITGITIDQQRVHETAFKETFGDALMLTLEP